MELILVRHGQAEDSGTDGTDETRGLTLEGQKSLQKSMSGYCRLINSQKKYLIWSSPLIRARQTADLFAQVLHVKKICQCDFIATGDFDAFINTLEDVAEDTCLILVGHEPYLSSWSQQICGISLPFKKGAAAALKMDLKSVPEGELLWFAQPRTFRLLSK